MTQPTKRIRIAVAMDRNGRGIAHIASDSQEDPFAATRELAELEGLESGEAYSIVEADVPVPPPTPIVEGRVDAD